MARKKKQVYPKKPGTGDFFLRGLPMNVKNKFRAHCAEKGSTMRTVLLKYMCECVGEDYDLYTSGVRRDQQ